MQAVRTLAPKLARALAGLIALGVLSAWLVPPLLDWGRTRGTIAAIAGARLGRRVVIGGPVSLRLLPEAVLTASDVELPDQGDGISAHLGSLRLRVALGQLLAGRIVARDLALGDPELRLPWPLPASITHPARPLVPRGFAARLEGGSLWIGQAQASGISATLRGDALTGALGASGAATVGGRSWVFDGHLGAPAAEGVSPLDLAVGGKDALRDTTGHFRGSVSGAALHGDIDIGGGNLAQFAPAPSVAWHASGPLNAAADRIEAPALAFAAGHEAAKGAAMLALSPVPRLDLRIQAASVTPQSWLGLLGGAGRSGLDFTFALSAPRATLLGGTLGTLDLAISGASGALRLDHAWAVLPGGAQAALAGAISGGGTDMLAVTGPGSLDVPDPRATLAWLRSLAPPLADVAAAFPLAHASLAGLVTLQPGRVGIDGLTGMADGVPVSGSLSLTAGKRPGITADLHADRMTLENLPAAALRNPGFDADIKLHAKAARIAGIAFADLALDAHEDAGGTTLRRLEAATGSSHFRASGTLGKDGAIADGRLTATTEDAYRLRQALPAGWQGSIPVWHGPADMELVAAGPPDALALQLRADAGDLRLEAESLLDEHRRSAITTMTLRHPGAPRLLAELGFPGAEAWLGTGSFALRAHLQTSPGHASVRDFDVNAASLRLGGHADIDAAAPVTRIEASIAADSLTLPAWSRWQVPPGGAWVRGLSGHLSLRAREVLAGWRPFARNFSADLALEQGIVLASPISAAIGDGRLTGQVAMAVDQAAPHVSVQADLSDFTLDAPLTGLPLDLVSGTLDSGVDAYAAGTDAASVASSLTGTMRTTVHQGTMGGLDLSRLARALAVPPRQRGADLRAGLAGGASTGLEGPIEATMNSGQITLRPASFAVPSGTVAVSGTLAAYGAATEIHVTATPDVPAPPSIIITLSGPWSQVRRSDDLSQAMAWGTHPAPKLAAKRRKPSSHPK